MKFLIFIFCFLLHRPIHCKPAVDGIKPIADKCFKETSIDEASLAAARKGNFQDNEEILKKYLLCIFKAMDVIDYEHHDFEYYKILSLLPSEMKKPAFDMGKGCLHIRGEDYGLASLEFVKCLHKANPEKFDYIF